MEILVGKETTAHFTRRRIYFPCLSSNGKADLVQWRMDFRAKEVWREPLIEEQKFSKILDFKEIWRIHWGALCRRFFSFLNITGSRGLVATNNSTRSSARGSRKIPKGQKLPPRSSLEPSCTNSRRYSRRLLIYVCVFISRGGWIITVSFHPSD